VSGAYVVAPAALDDIDATAGYLAERSLPAAERFLDEVYLAFERLADNPNLGHARSDLTPLPVFFWTAFARYAVIYRKTAPLQIVRVLAWKQDLPTMLRPEDMLPA
jgi:plasmid stabilization system protein ParE